MPKKLTPRRNKQSGFFDSLAKKRSEHVFECSDIKTLKGFLKSHKEVRYPKKFATTLYMCGRKKISGKPKPLSHAAIKVRFYHDKPMHRFFIPNKDAACITEIKTRPKDDWGSTVRQKARFGVDSIMSYRDLENVSEEVLSGKKIKKINNETVSLSRCLKKIANEYNLVTFEAVAATSYRRRHFDADNHRITVDSDIKYYLTATHDRDTLFSLARRRPGFVLEVKVEHVGKNLKNDDGDHLLKELGKIPGLIAEPNRKGADLLDLVLQKEHLFHEPELKAKSSSEWLVTEREMKLDADNDLRVQLGGIRFPENIAVGMIRKDKSYQRIYSHGSNIVFSMQYNKDSPPSKRVIKYKMNLKSSSSKISVRQETVERYSKKRISEILGNPVDDKSTLITSYFLRDRAILSVYLSDTGNVFDICVDEVNFIGKKKSIPLHQLEIEFVGVIGDKDGKSFIKNNVRTIESDFMVIRKIIMHEYARLGIALRDSHITKAIWAMNQVSR